MPNKSGIDLGYLKGASVPLSVGQRATRLAVSLGDPGRAVLLVTQLPVSDDRGIIALPEG
jgi:hypothetical protein